MPKKYSRRQKYSRPVRPVPTDPSADEPLNDRPPFNESAPPQRTTLRLEYASVAEYVAQVVIKNHMDFEAATKEILPRTRWNAKSLHEWADRIEKHEAVRKNLEEYLSCNGMDETSRTTYIKMLWEWMRGEDVKLKMTAARLLGRGFIAEKVSGEKPETLPIEGFADGTKKLFEEDEEEVSHAPFVS